jgi:hypothetical protein
MPRPLQTMRTQISGPARGGPRKLVINPAAPLPPVPHEDGHPGAPCMDIGKWLRSLGLERYEAGLSGE